MSDNPYIIAGNALEGTSCGDYDVSSAIVDALYDAGFITPDPRIIRTVAELEAIDPDAMLVRGAHDWEDPRITMSAQEWLADWGIDHSAIFPLAVIATGEQVRAALKALEKETE